MSFPAKQFINLLTELSSPSLSENVQTVEKLSFLLLPFGVTEELMKPCLEKFRQVAAEKSNRGRENAAKRDYSNSKREISFYPRGLNYPTYCSACEQKHQPGDPVWSLGKRKWCPDCAVSSNSQAALDGNKYYRAWRKKQAARIDWTDKAQTDKIPLPPAIDDDDNLLGLPLTDFQKR